MKCLPEEVILKNKYCSKILLFGEYSVIKGSHGLAVAYPALHGQFVFDSLGKRKTGALGLFDFYQYLNGFSLLQNHLDLDLFLSELNKGLYFKSNIPHGYGVGSSGAVCAGIFDRYSRVEVRDDLSLVKDLLALMESFYHGTSSGVDPLISYSGKSFFIEKRNSIKEITVNHNLLDNVYLIDSGIKRSTAELVKIFQRRLQQKKMSELHLAQFIQLNNKIINSFNSGFLNMNSIAELSEFQYESFQEMIPESIKSQWEDIMNRDGCSIKLCGAGGGGFFLFFGDREIAESTFGVSRVFSIKKGLTS